MREAIRAETLPEHAAKLAQNAEEKTKNEVRQIKTRARAENAKGKKFSHMSRAEKDELLFELLQSAGFLVKE